MSKELEVIGQGPVSIESYADNLQAKLQVANILLKSGMAPATYRSPEQVLGAVLYGRELGFSPIRALHMINVIQGKPTLAAEGLKALAIQNGGRIKTVEWTDKICTLECTRGDWVEIGSYSWEDAQTAGLTGKDNWKRMPKPMLYARCVSMLVRNMFADILGGLYSAEEMRDAIPEPRPIAVANVRPAIELLNVDPKTGEVTEDDLPETFTKSRLEHVKELIAAEDVKALGELPVAIVMKGEQVTQSISAWVNQLGRPTTISKLSKFGEGDRLAFRAYLEATEEVGGSEDDEDDVIEM